jgi:MerR family transcriptional regulator, copper efflux regulator
MEQTSEKLLRVGELAKAVGKTVRAIHLYEELGLVKPSSRTASGYRLYAPDAVARVTWIHKLQDMGFSLPEIQGFLKEWEGSSSGPQGMARVRAIFEAKLRETHETIARLQALETDLRDSLDYLESCGTCAPSHVTSECGVCNHNGHDPDRTPDLVAGLAKPKPGFDVPLSQLGHQAGTRE